MPPQRRGGLQTCPPAGAPVRQDSFADTQWQTQGNEAGVALEYLIQPANTLDADP